MELNLLNILNAAVINKISDVFIVAGLPISYKINGNIKKYNEVKITATESADLIEEIYHLADRPFTKLDCGDDDFSFAIKGLSRFRISAYRQRGSLAVVIRVISFNLPSSQMLNIPDRILNLSQNSKGLVLVTGFAGSGKSTTLACMVDHINNTRSCHVITLEDPIEFLHTHKNSIVSQREIPNDSTSYSAALKSSLRQAPDVILLGEMRDYETIDIAMTAAETGHLVLSSLHTIGAANTIDRIIDVFPENQQRQITAQLSMVLQAVVSQQLVPTIDGNLVPAFEIMIVTPAIRNMIREGKVHQIDSVIGSSSSSDMILMDTSLANLMLQGIITSETALQFSTNPETFIRKYNLKKML